MVQKKDKNFRIINFKIILKKNIINYFLVSGKKGVTEFIFLKLFKKIRKKKVQKPFFYIWKNLHNCFINIKLIELKKTFNKTNYYIKKLNFIEQLKNSIKLKNSKKEIFLFFSNLSGSENPKKIELKKIEQFKYQIRKII